MSTALTVNSANPRIYGKPWAHSGLLLGASGLTEATVVALTSVLPFSAQSGAPTHNASVVGEIYYRIDATSWSNAVYRATDTSGTWVAQGVISELDLSVALTAAGDLILGALTINHATASVEGSDITVTQLTTARTGGVAAAYKATVVGVATDTSGGTYVGLDLVATPSGGSALFTGLRFDAGWTSAIDSSSMATGENDWIVGANLADALTIRTSALNYSKLVTTTATPGWVHTFTQTDTGDAESIALSINDADGTSVGLRVSAAQITTARTSGTVTAVKGAVTSLTGDTAGVDYYSFEAAVTVGEAGADHFAFKLGAGFDAFLDASSAATGETDVLVGANLADAWTWRGASLTYSKLVTSTATPGWVHTFTQTATGDAENIALSVNSASSTSVGLSVSAAQITTVRTSGTVSGVKSSVTSLTGDTAGVGYYAFEAAVTAGEAAADHIAFKVGAGFDAWLDLSAIATGEGDVIIKDNLADAFSIREGNNFYFSVVTTDSAERTEIRGPRPIGPTATAITGATALTIADTGRVFTVSQAAAYDIDLPSPTVGADLRYVFQLVAPGANNVTVTVLGGAASFEGSIQIDGATAVATGNTLTFASGAALLGDNIEVISTSTSKYLVRAVASGAGGITIS